MIQTNQGSERYEIPVKEIPIKSRWRRLFHMDPTVHDILCATNHRLIQGKTCHDSREYQHVQPTFLNSKVRHSFRLSKELVSMDEQCVIKKYQFGIIYLAPGQNTESQALSNRLDRTSHHFLSFLSFLGMSADLTQKYLPPISWNEYEILFQYGGMQNTLILLFNESEKPFQPDSVRSDQVHVLLEVRPVEFSYQMACYFKKDVGPFPPRIPDPGDFQLTRDFILQKCKSHYHP